MSKTKQEILHALLKERGIAFRKYPIQNAVVITETEGNNRGYFYLWGDTGYPVHCLL
jgi:hypothetical protein